MSIKKKGVFYSEGAYILGLILLAIGVVFAEKSDFGVSMIVAPAYVLYRFINPFWGAFSFGMAEYCLQAALIVIMCIILRKFRLSYLVSFLTAVIYGWILDGFMMLGAYLPDGGFWLRIIYYVVGTAFSTSGVAMMFHTYISPEAYELLVKEISKHFNLNINKFKTIYDLSSFVFGVVLSFCCFGFGNFVGIGWGTVICSIINGTIIGLFSKLLDSLFEFKDALKWRTFFENK